MVAPVWSFKSGKITETRICHRRRFFKSFAILQVRRESFRRQTPFNAWELFGQTCWTDVNPTNLAEVKEVMNLLESINA